MSGLVRYLAGYVLDFFRERVSADDFREDRVARVVVPSSLDAQSLSAVRALFPEAQLYAFSPRAVVSDVRRCRCDAACIPMAGDGMRQRLLGLVSGARHKILLPSPEYAYRLGMRRGWGALYWAAVDRFLLAPIALVWLGILSLGMYLTGLVATAEAAERGAPPWRPKRVLAIRLMPSDTFIRLLRRVKQRFPQAEVVALLASDEGRSETQEVCDEVISPREAGTRRTIARLRNSNFDTVVLAGGADYGLSFTYLKAALLARFCRRASRYQWEVGDELPGTPLRRAVLAAARPRPPRAPAALRRLAWRRRYSREPSRGPAIVQIGLTQACNYHCLFCPFHSPPKEKDHNDAELPRMSREMFARLLGDLKRMGTRMVDICGDGEPLMHAEAIGLIALARELEFDVTLATNAALLTEKRARRLVDLGVQRMHVSFNAALDETYEAIHPGTPPGTRSKVIERLRDMAEYADAEGKRPIDVEFSAVLNRLNMAEIPAMVEVAHEARANWFMLILMGPVEGAEDLLPRPEDWILIQSDIERAADRARRLGIRTNLGTITPSASGAGTRSVYERIPCHIGHEYALVLADGSVLFCCQCSLPLGNLNEDSFERIWYSRKYEKARRLARELPKTREHLPGCECFTACSHVAVNLDVYRRLHGSGSLKSVL